MKQMKLLISLVSLFLISSCSPKQKQPTIIILTKDCRFYRIVKSKDLQGKFEELENIKANNIDACERCPQFKNSIECKRTLKLRDLEKKRLENKFLNK